LTIWTFVKNWSTILTYFNFSLNSLNVKLSEWENLREFSCFKISLLPKLFSININNVTSLINQISFFIDLATKIIKKFTAILVRSNISLLVLINLTHNVFNIETFSTIIEEFVKIITSKLTFIKLLATILIDNVTLVWNCKPAVIIYTAGFFVNIKSLRCFHKNWLSS